MADASTEPAKNAKPTRGSWLRFVRLALPYGVIAFVYLATSPYHHGLNNPNEMVRVYMSKAWVDTGHFSISPIVRSWGPVDDKAIRGGKLYSSKAPLQSLVGIPAYAVAPTILGALGTPANKRTQTWVVRVLGAAVYGIAFAWVLLAWSRRRCAELDVPVASGTVVGLALALGTMLYPYSITFTGHGLAALTAGGCFLAVVMLSRAEPEGGPWIRAAVVAGFLGGAAPFSEYPAALVAAPALVAALVMMPTVRVRAALLGWLAVGGALPFGLGLWAHWKLWGHPFRTGYTFLENASYVQVHGEGFFGVSVPKAEAFVGTLVSPGTGLFFFSPLLVAGLVAAGWAAFAPQPQPPQRAPIRRPLAWATLLAFAASMYFISAHKGWRGGWTVGPRYIIAVAPMLGLWVVEALRWPKARPVVAGLAGLSVIATGFATALYPHLSDVYTNPLATFLWPSYLAGETTYGLGHSAGLSGHAANAVHVVPLLAVTAYCVAAARDAKGLVIAVAVVAAGLAVVAVVPERDAGAAQRENRRLWGFWEPAGAGEGPASARRHRRPGRVYRARTAFRGVRVSATTAAKDRRCGPFKDRFCRYGDHPWQRFGPERMNMGGISEDVLFLHPIAGQTVRATVPVRAGAKTWVLRYGMADASVGASNPHPIQLRVRQADAVLAQFPVPLTNGLKKREWPVTSTQAITLELTVKQDGARVFGFDVEQYR